MILLDTNVLFEPLKPAYSQSVIDWLNAQRPETLGTTTLTRLGGFPPGSEHAPKYFRFGSGADLWISGQNAV
ncbi:MAG: hypothetical protein AB1651_17180 [Pseudomonadota bacterium]